ncbi:hypothetical protein A79_0411 [Vibrio parahaemolyticus AQ3810]|nr:hypothetical protein A79_0411 [Vibrio parahaemolyticus AQ3810]EFO42163.1 conserved hypothetical protein [Vibrio parahaemolyticus AN-5034]EQM00366.1 hypothetical protein D040_0758 [Vibrio parahaemolyticus NIHCB0603]EQM08291.1 hypothetical protein D045_0225 [Vibrio parahaemolyticus VP-NY4]EQM46259.1 hypothetical protein D025_1313 [Vibrio parahaemolyticus 949]ETS22592.1 hypothetical protein D033_1721 [Vibrio parahaemolyticus B-265]ETT13000.1 hypothetical protein D026_0162 [Vibrio parahaemolyt
MFISFSFLHAKNADQMLPPHAFLCGDIWTGLGVRLLE